MAREAKPGQGFYKKTVNAEGKKEILSLDLDTMEYRSEEKKHQVCYIRINQNH